MYKTLIGIMLLSFLRMCSTMPIVYSEAPSLPTIIAGVKDGHAAKPVISIRRTPTPVAAKQSVIVQRNYPPRIIQTDLVASYTFAEGRNQFALNQVGTNAHQTTPNLYGIGEQFATSVAEADGWAAGAVTLTDFYATDPNGTANSATRLVAKAGAGPSLYKYSTLPAGTFTVSFWVKSNTDVSQAIRFTDFIGTLSSDKPVTTSWSQVSYTFTLGSPKDFAVGIVDDAAHDALDILIYGAKLEPGSSPTAYVVPTFDLQLGNEPVSDINDPSWVSTGLSLAANKYAYGVSTAGMTSTNISIYAVVKKTGSDLSSGMEPILGEIYDAERLHLGSADQNGGSPLLDSKVPVFMFGGSRLYAYGVILNDGNWHVLTGTYDGTTQKLFLDGTLVGIKTVTISAQTIHRLYAGRFDAANTAIRYFPGIIGSGALYSAAHDTNSVQQNVTALQGDMARRSVVMTNLEKFIAIEGDSLTDPTSAPGALIGNGWAYQMLHGLSPTIQAFNAARSGSATRGLTGATNIFLRSANVDATCDSTRAFDLAILFIGANDLNSGISASNFVTNVKTWASDRKSACPGRKVLIATLLPQNLGNPAVNPLKDSINAMLVADASISNGTVADGLVRLDLEPHIGPNAAASDTSLYYDGEHLTAVGQGYAAAVFLTAVNNLHP